jgi:methionyl-tRNA formyltransferase
MLRVAVAGGGRLGMSLIEPLMASEHEVVAIVQDGRKTRGVRRLLNPWLARLSGSTISVGGFAVRHGLPIVWIDKMAPEELAPLRRLEPDLLLVGGFGIILKEPILQLPRIGCVNCHSSLLPRHRGPNPFAWALLSGDEESGVTFHVMDPGIDTGDILDQTPLPLKDDDSTLSVYRRSCELAAARVVEVVDRIARDGLRGTPQDASRATYERNPTEADAWIRWDRPARAIVRQVRALAPSPAPRFLHDEKLVYVFRADALEDRVDAPPGTVLGGTGAVEVATASGRLRILAAFTRTPLPWVWPSPWQRLRAGEVLPMPPPMAPPSKKGPA